MSRYIQDPNDSKKQIPGPLPANAYGSATNPPHCTHVKAPSGILVNTLLTTPVGFHFGGTSASLSADGNTTIGNYTVMLNDAAAGTKLDIHPNAWSGSAADAGSITFVYKGGLSTGGI
jgi:hypothetical protein